MKKSSLYGVKLRKRLPSPSSIESIRTKDNYEIPEMMISKKSTDAEDWDCPRPGKQNSTRTVRENNRKIGKEKKKKMSEKNKNESYTQTLLP